MCVYYCLNIQYKLFVLDSNVSESDSDSDTAPTHSRQTIDHLGRYLHTINIKDGKVNEKRN